jgi:membrane-associated phospholipid phosphatase
MPVSVPPFAIVRRLLVALLLGGTLVAAAEAPRLYLETVPVPDLMRILPPPPAPGSPRNIADRAIFRATRALQGSNRWAVARRDADDDQFTTFACAIGMQLDAKSAPATLRVFDRTSSGVLVDPVKQGYATRRPYLNDDQPICEPKTAHLASNGDYPSGHTTNGWSTALLLAELLPERATEILARGRAYGESRYICGSDSVSAVEAGYMSGSVLVATLHAAPEFRRDMDAARAELAALRASAPPAPAAQCAQEARALR